MGEAPGAMEVAQGEPFVGPTGRLLEKFFNVVGLELHGGDFYLMNALSCRVFGKRGVKKAISSCAPRVLSELASVNKDAIIVLMGVNARESVFPGEKGGILSARGWRRWNGHDMYITAHPSYYLYNPNQAPMLLKDVQRIERGRLPQIGPFDVLRPEEYDIDKVLANLKQNMITGGYGEDSAYLGYVLDQDGLDKFNSMLHSIPIENRGKLAFDIETDQIDFQRDRLLCMSISPIEHRAFIIPDSVLYEDGREFVTTDWTKKMVKSFLDDERYLSGSYLRPSAKARAQLMELWAIPKYEWVGHNAKFDLRFIVSQLGVSNGHVDFDTIAAHYALDERKEGHSLKPLADDYFDVGDYEHGLDKYLPKKSGRWSKVPRRVLYKYNAMDTEVTLRLARALEEELRANGLYEQPFQRPLMKAIPMLLRAEIHGVWIDWKENYRIGEDELTPAIEQLRKDLQDISGHSELNPNSPMQVIPILFDELGFPEIEARTRAGGHRVTGRTSQKAMLDAWTARGESGELDMPQEAWEFLDKLQQYRHLRKLYGSYVKKWRKHRGTDDRVHATYLLRGTQTGRLSATDPPVQTIPSKIADRWGPMVANMHKAAPGYVLMYADYSQAELMFLAGLSKCKFMIQTFKEGKDYNSEVARMAFGEDFTREDRQKGKKLTYGWAYGGTVEAIALDALQFTPEVAKHFAHRWDDMFPEVVEWREEQANKMLSQGYVESVYGRRRRRILITEKNVGKAKRIAVNSPIQSAVSDITILSAVRLYEIYENDPDVEVVLLIHDSCILEVKEERVEEVKEVMHRVMLETPSEILPDIPFRAEVKTSRQLGDLT